jgi:hypothetical protein
MEKLEAATRPWLFQRKNRRLVLFIMHIRNDQDANVFFSLKRCKKGPWTGNSLLKLRPDINPQPSKAMHTHYGHNKTTICPTGSHIFMIRVAETDTILHPSQRL